MRDDRLFETFLDAAAAVWISGSLAYAIALAAGQLELGFPLLLALGGGGVGALATFRSLQAIERPPMALASFELTPLEPLVFEMPEDGQAELLLTPAMAVRPTELLLTKGQMLHKKDSAGTAELLLDDVLTELKPDSRVVQLFDPTRMPTAGELKSRIDRHLSRERRDVPGNLPDASQALFDALADLRRSLG